MLSTLNDIKDRCARFEERSSAVQEDVREIKGSVAEISNYLFRGNGFPSLNTRMALVENRTGEISKNMGDASKSKSKLLIALISGLIGGVSAIITAIISLFK